MEYALSNGTQISYRIIMFVVFSVKSERFPELSLIEIIGEIIYCYFLAIIYN